MIMWKVLRCSLVFTEVAVPVVSLRQLAKPEAPKYHAKKYSTSSHRNKYRYSAMHRKTNLENLNKYLKKN